MQLRALYLRKAANTTKITSMQDPTSHPIHVCRRRECNCQRALGKETQLGSLEVGKIADLAALELQAAATQPLHQLHSQLIYSASSSQFSDVWVAGERLLKDRQPTRFHADQLLAEAALWPARFRGDASVGPSL